MKRAKSVEALSARRWRPSHILLAVAALYLVFISFKFRRFLEIATVLSGEHSFTDLDRPLHDDHDVGRHLFGSVHPDATVNRRLDDGRSKDPPRTPHDDDPLVLRARSSPIKPFRHRYGRITGEILRRQQNRTGDLSQLERMAHEAWTLGMKAWEEVESYEAPGDVNLTAMLEDLGLSC